MRAAIFARWALAIGAALAVMSAGAAACTAQDEVKPRVTGLRVGFDNIYRVGYWAPVELTLHGGTDPPATGLLTITVPDGDGTPTIVPALRPVGLLTGQKTRVLVYAKFGQTDGTLKVELRDGRDELIEETIDFSANRDNVSLPVALSAEDRIIVTVGPSIGMEDALKTQIARGDVAVVALRDVAQLPSEWYGYDGVEAVVLSGGRPEIYTQLGDAQAAALEEWVSRGGKLIMGIGSAAPTLLAPGQPLAALAPGRFAESTALRRTTDLEGYAGGSHPVQLEGDELSLPIPRLTDLDGSIELEYLDVPLVVRAPRGFGQVVFVGVDFDQQPLADWSGRAQFIRRVIDPRLTAVEADAPDAMAMPSYYGVNDTARQLREALDHFSEVMPVSFGLVAFLIFGYILLIGPGDYFLVKKLLGRMELTWITFPLIVAGVCGAAYGFAYWAKGDRLGINQVDLVDVDTASKSGMVRGTSWMSIYSPQTSSFDLAMRPLPLVAGDAPQADVLMSWLGLPGNLGGISGRSSGGLLGRGYAFSPQLDRLFGVPIPVWASKAFTSDWSYPAGKTIESDLTLGLGQVPEGTVRNSLRYALHNCLLISGRWAYVLDDLDAGEEITLRSGNQRDRDSVLDALPPAMSTSGLEAIVRRLIFFDAAGGEERTQMQNNYLRSIDFSAQLNLPRAYLVATADHRASELLDGDKALESTTGEYVAVYRFVLPVRSEATTP